MTDEPQNEPSGLHQPVQPPKVQPSATARLRAWLKRLAGK
jgi:hypothetical protein